MYFKTLNPRTARRKLKEHMEKISQILVSGKNILMLVASLKNSYTIFKVLEDLERAKKESIEGIYVCYADSREFIPLGPSSVSLIYALSSKEYVEKLTTHPLDPSFKDELDYHVNRIYFAKPAAEFQRFSMKRIIDDIIVS